MGDLRACMLTKRYNGVTVVRDVEFVVRPGEVLGYLGPNGSGKTTTVRLLLGLLEPSAGSATVLGRPVPAQAGHVREQTGALMENNGLYERLTAEDNLDFYGRIYRMGKADRLARIEELLRHFGLWERRKDLIREWSRGMRQKLAIARALMHRPPLVFLDEPTAGLDPLAAVALRDDLAALVEQEGVTVFLNTHNLVEAEKLCGLVGVIRQGRLVAVGHPDTLRARSGAPRLEITGAGFSEALLEALQARPEVAAARLENSHLVLNLAGQAETGPLVTLIVSFGVQIDEVRRGRASLEDVFVALMAEETGADE